MRDEQSQSLDILSHVSQHGLGDGDAVMGAGAAAQLVEDDEAAAKIPWQSRFSLANRILTVIFIL